MSAIQCPALFLSVFIGEINIFFLMKVRVMFALALSLIAATASGQRLSKKEYMVSRENNGFISYRGQTVGATITLIEGKKYEVLNPDDFIVLYRTYEQNGKSIVAKHFFSQQGSSDVKPLTLQNLKTEFPEEQDFHEKLDILARNNFELVKYKDCINRIYQNTVN
jgi:hypothetical protein